MITQIQTYFSHFLTKLVALALFLFILTSFNLQIITATAQVTPPADNTAKPNLSKDFSQGQDSRIGTLKNCSVDNKSADYQTKLKTDPTEANTFIFNCLKDIIQIVITISVILAVMRLIFVGIKFLNTFGDEAALQGELSKAITGFVAGAVILGLFATIIQVVNPSALKIDKIFSAQVIADYKCLDKGIGGNKSTGCKDTKQGSGPGVSSEVFTSENIKTVLASTKPEDKAKQDEIKASISKCNSVGNITLASAEEALNCNIFQQYASENPNLASVVALDTVLEPNMTGNRFANGTYSNIIVNGKIITTDYKKIGSDKVKKVVFEYYEGCEKSPLLIEKTITSGKPINIGNCNMNISSNK
jgi:hypothetical protein